MKETKIRLSEKEMDLLTNADWILTKNGLMHKVRRLLETLLEQQGNILQQAGQELPAPAFNISPKISKGENYLGLPYLILDQPKVFGKKNIFAIRTMFWWGNYFSTTLHLSGLYKNEYSSRLIFSRSALLKNGFYVCIHPEEWVHHFEKDNYLPI